MKTNEQVAFIGPKGLKPCPLCGGPASVYEYTAGVIWTTPTVEATRIGCDRCGLEIRGDGAARAWNTRAGRTCRLVPTRGVKHYPTALMLDCSECGTRFKYGEQPEPGEYCRGCGAKVVE